MAGNQYYKILEDFKLRFSARAIYHKSFYFSKNYDMQNTGRKKIKARICAHDLLFGLKVFCM